MEWGVSIDLTSIIGQGSQSYTKEIDLAFGAKDRKAHVILFLDFFLIYFPYNDDLTVPS
jgi:hypothetical protein